MDLISFPTLPEINFTRFILLSIGAIAFAGVGALLASKSSSVSLESSVRFEDSSMGVIGDSINGDIFGWIDTPNGRRFVRFDKISESKVRQNSAPKPAKPEVKIIYRDRNAQPKNDVRSGRIFEKNNKFIKGGTTFAVNTRIKYRTKENRMLYRVAISALPQIGEDQKPAQCLSKSRNLP